MKSPFLIIATLIGASLFLFSCKDKKSEIIKTIAEMKGKVIIIPDDTSFNAMKDSVVTSYAVVEYIDSSSCVSCRFNMEKWNELIQLYQSYKSDMKFFFILESKPTKQIIYTMRWDKFYYPVMFDSKGLFAKENKLPKSNEYHTMLIDKDYKIVAVGSPATNSQVDDFYQNIISE